MFLFKPCWILLSRCRHSKARINTWNDGFIQSIWLSFTRPRYFPGWYHKKFMCCVSIHINLVSVFGICHEEILQAYSGARKGNRNHFRKVDTWGWYTRIWTMASGPSLFLHSFSHCSISLHSFTDNNYKIKVIAVLIPEKKRSCYGLLFLLYKRI